MTVEQSSASLKVAEIVASRATFDLVLVPLTVGAAVSPAGGGFCAGGEELPEEVLEEELLLLPPLHPTMNSAVTSAATQE